jgi:hypothetical protein
MNHFYCVSSFFVGMGVAMTLLLFILHGTGERDLIVETKDKLFFCEQELPRNQKCVIMVIPDNTKATEK